MQPYLFPYIGYFQLINAVDKFVFYDDVDFIKNGWINRNRILLNEKSHYITVQLKNASSFKLINCIEFTDNRNKLKKTIEQAYKNAPYFHSVWPIIEECFSLQTNLIGSIAIYSVLQTAKYLQIKTSFEISSENYGNTKTLGRSERLVEICKNNNAAHYINPVGGMELYNKQEFEQYGINLNFLRQKNIEYRQFNNVFIPWLSIIDVMMFNSKEEISKMLNEYELI